MLAGKGPINRSFLLVRVNEFLRVHTALEDSVHLIGHDEIIARSVDMMPSYWIVGVLHARKDCIEEYRESFRSCDTIFLAVIFLWSFHRI